jgi:geranylgeranyl diphosphate synthase, type II
LPQLTFGNTASAQRIGKLNLLAIASLELDLATELATVRTRIDAELSAILESHRLEVPARLLNAMSYALLSSGKRMRPALVLWAAEACGLSDSKRTLPGAAAVEMIHAYSLIHDDLPAMDNDDLRRGQPTTHRKFDEATAILAGDGLLTLAFGVLARGCEPQLAAASCAELATAAGIAGMVGGQADDLAAEGRFETPLGPPNAHTMQSIHERKTGAMIRVSLRLGGLAAGANARQLAALDDYGGAVGLAFQIADDLLDVEGTEVETGKRVGKDVCLGKMTYPAYYGIETSRQMAAQLIERAIAAIQPFGTAASKLEALARYVLERKH